MENPAENRVGEGPHCQGASFIWSVSSRCCVCPRAALGSCCQPLLPSSHHPNTSFFFFNVYLFLRECEWGIGREREAQNPKQAPGSELSAQGRTRGWNSRTTHSEIMT